MCLLASFMSARGSRHAVTLVLGPLALLHAVGIARADLDVDSRGELGTEARVFFPDDTLDSDIGNVAMTGRLQIDAALDDAGALDDVSARLRVFSRLDPYDDVRTRIIPEELYVTVELDAIRLRVGYQMINWTATEAFHPADILNSRIFDGNFENPEKIGEPMAALRFDHEDGNLELFVMPAFTAPVLPSSRSPLSFTGPQFALGEVLVLDRNGNLTDDALQLQWGTQLQHTVGSADIAVHLVQHIDRTTPLVVFDSTFTPRPVFQAVTQLGLTYQHALDTTVLKLEGAYRIFDRPGDGMTALGPVPRRNHALIAAGIEQSLSRGDGSDTSVLIEGQVLIPGQADYPKLLEPLFQHDVLIGVRHAFNDEQSTAIIATVIIDVENPEQLVMGAAFNRRLGESWGLTAGFRLLRIPPDDPSAPLLFENLHDQHHVYADLKRYF